MHDRAELCPRRDSFCALLLERKQKLKAILSVFLKQLIRDYRVWLCLTVHTASGHNFLQFFLSYALSYRSFVESSSFGLP